jgi:diguanylate cyclase (GGDEF)-like protein/PAS domain S-box-containing protein
MLRGIRSRLLGLVVATVVPLVALIGVGLWSQWRNDEAAAIQRALDEARLLAGQVDDLLGNLDNLLIGLSQAISWDPADTAANDALLRRAKTELPSFVANIFIFDLEGNNIGFSVGPEFDRPHVANRSFFQKILAGERLAFGGVMITTATGRPVVPVSRAIYDDTGRLRAVLATGALLNHFQDALRIQTLPPGSVVRVLDEKGIVIARSVDGPVWIGRDLSDVGDVHRHLAAKEISEVTRWADNVDRITGSATAHLAPWLVSVGLPSEIAFAGVIRHLGWGALFGLTTLLISFVIAWTLSGRIVGPLRRLRKDTAMLAVGELSHRSAVRTQDEVGSLADDFNRMAARLEQRQDEARIAADKARVAADDLQRAKDTLAVVIDASPVAIVCCDTERRIFLWSRAAEGIFGYTAEEATGQLAHLMPPRQSNESQNVFKRALGGETLQNVRMKRLRKDGTAIDVRIAAAPMYNPDGTVRGVARAYEDITEYVRAEQQLERLAHYDQLTGLPNRLSLQKELGRLLSGDCIRPTAIALFDLDGFKDVNDTLGHSIGDQLLIEVGRRLGDVAGGRGQVCRLGGDEFVVVIPSCGNPLAIGELIETMLRRLAEPYRISDQILHIAGSAGVAIAPGHGSNTDELIANADLALYQAKSHGGRTCRFFMPVLRAKARARRSLDLELRRAYAESEFELYFQPQIRLADEAVVGAEALIRWRHPEQGILAPGAFIDTLAASSIAPVVSQWIIWTACAMTAQWRAAGLPLGRIAVNLFPSQVGDEALLRDIDAVLKATDLPAHALELEITENVALNFEDAATLQKLHEKGVKLALDDFGTGYASLSYLTRFPLARIKIDRTFVGNVIDAAGDAAIVRSLIAMAHNLGLKVIAEGVETGAQAAFLLKEQCEEAQGYLYAKPLPAADFEAYLRTRHLSLGEAAAQKRTGPHTQFQRPARRAPGRRRLPAP